MEKTKPNLYVFIKQCSLSLSQSPQTEEKSMN